MMCVVRSLHGHKTRAPAPSTGASETGAVSVVNLSEREFVGVVCWFVSCVYVCTFMHVQYL